METMDKELTVQEWGLIIWLKIPQIPKNLFDQFVQFAQKLGILLKKDLLNVRCFCNIFIEDKKYCWRIKNSHVELFEPWSHGWKVGIEKNHVVSKHSVAMCQKFVLATNENAAMYTV